MFYDIGDSLQSENPQKTSGDKPVFMQRAAGREIISEVL
jgi:hypothetical protein